MARNLREQIRALEADSWLLEQALVATAFTRVHWFTQKLHTAYSLAPPLLLRLLEQDVKVQKGDS